MSEQVEACEQCGKEQDEPLIVCPQCDLPRCDDCIAGRGVVCFSCEERQGDD